MNIVKFGKIAIYNFKSVGEEVTFDYRNFDGMTFVKGENIDMPDLSNGVGKSVIFVDALLMVLFGQLSNNVKNSQVFHRRATTNLGWIKLQMFVNEKEWNVHCVLQKSKTGNVSLSRSLYEGEVCDENSCTKSSMAQTLKFISDDILKCDADTFKNAVVLSTSNIQNFFTLPRPAKDAYLDSVFQLAAFGEVYAKIKKSANALKKELSSQREVFEGLKGNHEEILAKSEAFIESKQKLIDELEASIQIKDEEIKKLKEQTTDVDHLKDEIRRTEDKIAEDTDRLNELKIERDGIDTGEAGVVTLIDQYANELHEDLDKRLADIDKEIATYEKSIAEGKESVVTIEGKIKEFEDAIVKVNEAIKMVEEKEIAPLKHSLNERKCEITAMNRVKQQFEGTFELLCEECQKKTVDHFAFDQDKYDKLNTEVVEIDGSIEEQKKVIKSMVDKLCVVDEGKAKFEQVVKEAQDGVVTLKTEVDKLEMMKQSQRGEVATKITAKERELHDEARAEYQKAIADNLKRSEEISKLIEDAKDTVRSYKAQITENDSLVTRIQSANELLKDYASRYKEAKGKENPFESLVTDGEKKIKTAKDTIEVILKDQRKFELLAHIYDEDGVKKHIVSSIVASLNILIKKYLAEMGTDYTVVFNDKFEYAFYTTTGETDYLTFSSGERRRLDMAVMLALRDILFTNGLVTNVLIVDEVLDSGIDTFALFAILNILKNKTRDRDLGCIVISHRTEIFSDVTDTFDRLITVRKENSESAISAENTDQL